MVKKSFQIFSKNHSKVKFNHITYEKMRVGVDYEITADEIFNTGNLKLINSKFNRSIDSSMIFRNEDSTLIIDCEKQVWVLI